MSGYAKRMMEIAAAWLRENPEPGSALKLPYRDKLSDLNRLADPDEEMERVDQLIAKARRSGREDVLHQAEELRKAQLEQAAELRESLEQLKQLDLKLNNTLADLSTVANTPYRRFHGKTDRLDGADDPLYYTKEAPWLLAWARDGYNVFDLSADFVAAMLLTDPSEVDLPSLKLPFGGMLFTIPDQFAVGAEGTSYTKIHVVEIDDSLAFDWQAHDDATPTNDEKRPAITIYATNGPHILFTIAPRDELSWAALEELPDEVQFDADKEARKTIQRVVLGALAYATAVDRAITERFPAPKKRRDQKPSIAHWTIGRTIKIDPELVRTARGGAREIAFRIKSRFVVRGHYRNQAHGPNRSLRTMKWIAPFFKGPEEGAQLVHTYKPSPTEQDESKKGT